VKAFLLAGGLGTRLRPLTDRIPKCLVPVRGVPMLRIWLDLCALHGITDVLVNIHSHADAVRRFIESEQTGVNIRIFQEVELLGSAGTLRANRHWVKSEELFWILYTDVLTSANLSAMLKFHRQHQVTATLAVSEVADPTRCGIVATDSSGIILSFVEKPARPESNLAFSGLIVAAPGILELIPPKHPADIGFDVLPQLVGDMAAFRIKEYLLDVGTLSNYEIAQRTWQGPQR
jgi:mannose-1-phosphate guanylyltransferase